MVIRSPLLRAILLACLMALGGLSLAGAQDQNQDQESAPWYVADTDDVIVWHTQSQARADDLAMQGQGAYDLVSDLIDASLDDPLVLIVWSGDADPSDLAQRPPIDDDTPTRDIFRNTSAEVRNDVTNALLDVATGRYAGNLPIWMRAAMGFWSQGPLPGFYLRRAGSVTLFDHEEYYSIEQLEVVPTTWQFQAKYFGQAGGMLAWFIQDWGPDALAELFRSVGTGVDFYDAVEQVYGIPEDRLIAEFTKNAERALLLLWPYIEEQSPPFFEQLNINHILIFAVSVPGALFLLLIGKRMFWD